jgi:hypothetical protein
MIAAYVQPQPYYPLVADNGQRLTAVKNGA